MSPIFNYYQINFSVVSADYYISDSYSSDGKQKKKKKKTKTLVNSLGLVSGAVEAGRNR